MNLSYLVCRLLTLPAFNTIVSPAVNTTELGNVLLMARRVEFVDFCPYGSKV